MNTRRFALTLGIIYIIIGLAGFVPPLLSMPTTSTPPVGITTLHGYLFNLFPVNILHTIVHLAVGIWGVIAAKSLSKSVVFSKSTAILFAVLTIFGLIPGLKTLFGLIPLYGHDIWLHAITAIAAGYFGFSSVATRDESTGREAHP